MILCIKASQLNMGRKVEMEHTDDPKTAEKIAQDHLSEFGDYYTRLIQAEEIAKDDKKLDKIKKLVLAWLIKNPNAKDEQVHRLAIKVGVDKHKLEEIIYKFAADRAKMSEDVVKSLHKSKEQDKTFVHQLWDGTKVYFVKGSDIRDKYDDEWIGGGHGYRYKFIPKDEIWLETLEDPIDMKEILVHEIVEYLFMKYLKGDYDDSHHKANTAEDAVRRISRMDGPGARLVVTPRENKPESHEPTSKDEKPLVRGEKSFNVARPFVKAKKLPEGSVSMCSDGSRWQKEKEGEWKKLPREGRKSEPKPASKKEELLRKYLSIKSKPFLGPEEMSEIKSLMPAMHEAGIRMDKLDIHDWKHDPEGYIQKILDYKDDPNKPIEIAAVRHHQSGKRRGGRWGWIKKSKALPVGSVRTWGNKQYRKEGSGDWKEVKKQKGQPAEAHKESSHSGYMDLSSSEKYSSYVSNNFKEQIDKEYSTEQGKKELENVSAYSGNIYFYVRKIMIGDEPYIRSMSEETIKRAKDMIDSIDKYIPSHRINSDITLYRGAEGKVFRNLRVGDVFEHNTFASFSSDRDIADNFLEDIIDNDTLFPVVFVMKAKKGNPIAPALRRILESENGVEKMSMGFNEQEKEFLVARKTKWKVISKAGGYRYTELTVEVVDE